MVVRLEKGFQTDCSGHTVFTATGSTADLFIIARKFVEEKIAEGIISISVDFSKPINTLKHPLYGVLTKKTAPQMGLKTVFKDGVLYDLTEDNLDEKWFVEVASLPPDKKIIVKTSTRSFGTTVGELLEWELLLSPHKLRLKLPSSELEKAKYFKKSMLEPLKVIKPREVYSCCVYLAYPWGYSCGTYVDLSGEELEVSNDDEYDQKDGLLAATIKKIISESEANVEDCSYPYLDEEG